MGPVLSGTPLYPLLPRRRPSGSVIVAQGRARRNRRDSAGEGTETFTVGAGGLDPPEVEQGSVWGTGPRHEDTTDGDVGRGSDGPEVTTT